MPQSDRHEEIVVVGAVDADIDVLTLLLLVVVLLGGLGGLLFIGSMWFAFV